MKNITAFLLLALALLCPPISAAQDDPCNPPEVEEPEIPPCPEGQSRDQTEIEKCRILFRFALALARTSLCAEATQAESHRTLSIELAHNFHRRRVDKAKADYTECLNNCKGDQACIDLCTLERDIEIGVADDHLAEALVSAERAYQIAIAGAWAAYDARVLAARTDFASCIDTNAPCEPDEDDR